MSELKVMSRRSFKLFGAVRRYPGRFITFEGMDGSGKSTQINRLASDLKKLGVNVVLTREPGGTPLGESIRDLILDTGNNGMQATTELALMFAARAQHVAEVIEPALLRGDWVLCDRFVDSSEAYQGGGRCLGSGTVLTLQRVLLNGLSPDLTILLDHDIEESVMRARRRSVEVEGKESRFEDESFSFFERVQQAFRLIALRDQQRFFVTNARRSIEAVHDDILAEVFRRLFTHVGVQHEAVDRGHYPQL